jgi:AraC-like DNA-binding protein
MSDNRSVKRHEITHDQASFRTDSRGITRNSLLMSDLNRIHIELLDHGYFIGDQKWNQYGVISPFARLYYMIADCGWLDTEQGRIDLIPGTMYFIPPNTRVDLRTAQSIEKFYFHVTCRYLDTDILDGLNRCFVLPLQQSLLKQLLDAYQSGQMADLLTIKSLVYSTLASFIRDCLPDLSGRSELANRYQKLYAYIEKNLSAKLAVKDVCSDLGLSYETLRRQFRIDSGVTLHQYITDRLIQRAALSLLLTDRTIQEIANDLGFSDEFYFSRFFKQKMEYSPREYRRINAVLRRTGEG